MTGTPYSLVLHAFELHVDRYRDGFEHVPIRAANAVFTISELDAELAERRYGVRAGVLRMGVTDEWLDSPVPTDEREKGLLVSVGSLVAKKGHADLIEAVALARQPWRVVIVGEGPDRDQLRRRAAELGIGARVDLVGARGEHEVRDLVRRAPPSSRLASVVAPDGDRDGVPVAIMEAMASATPVLSTTVGAIGELVTGAGVLVQAGKPSALAAGLDALEDPELRATLGAAGRERVQRDFRSAATARAVVDLVGADSGAE